MHLPEWLGVPLGQHGYLPWGSPFAQQPVVDCSPLGHVIVIGAGVKGPGVAFVGDEEGVGEGAGGSGVLFVGIYSPTILLPSVVIVVPSCK